VVYLAGILHPAGVVYLTGVSHYISGFAAGNREEVGWGELDLEADLAGADKDFVETGCGFVDEGRERLFHANR